MTKQKAPKRPRTRAQVKAAALRKFKSAPVQWVAIDADGNLIEVLPTRDAAIASARAAHPERPVMLPDGTIVGHSARPTKPTKPARKPSTAQKKARASKATGLAKKPISKQAAKKKRVTKAKVKRGAFATTKVQRVPASVTTLFRELRRLSRDIDRLDEDENSPWQKALAVVDKIGPPSLVTKCGKHRWSGFTVTAKITRSLYFGGYRYATWNFDLLGEGGQYVTGLMLMRDFENPPISNAFLREIGLDTNDFATFPTDYDPPD